MTRTLASSCSLTLLFLAEPVLGQDLIIQQPVVQVFSADTVVSVPDRGSAFLGGHRTARSARSTYGPLELNPSLGFDYGDSYTEVSVFIHDFEAMDAALLNAAPQASPAPATAQPRARAAWNALRNRQP